MHTTHFDCFLLLDDVRSTSSNSFLVKDLEKYLYLRVKTENFSLGFVHDVLLISLFSYIRLYVSIFQHDVKMVLSGGLGRQNTIEEC